MFGAFVTVLLFISLSESAPNEAYPKRSGRIIGGAGAIIEEYPYQVQLEVQPSESFYCSGTIISEEWIVTSAKCIPVGPVGVLIRAGGDILGSGVSLHYQVNRYRHPKFDGYNYDVGLMSVNPKFLFSSTVQPISLDPITTPLAFVTGWGAYDARDPNAKSTTLQVELVLIMDQIDCDSFTGGTTTICTMLSETGPCGAYDWGDPLMVENKLVGIASAPACGNATIPTLYTDISKVREFIYTYAGV